MKKALITGITGQDGSYLAEFLLKKNYITAIVTSKDSVRTKKIISLFNLKFKYIFTPNNSIKPKPFPHQIYKIIELENVKKKNCY